MNNAMVLFSGGQDSTTCLAWALDRYDSVYTLGFNYGQRHVVELAVREPILSEIKDAFPHWGNRLAGDCVISLDVLAALRESALFKTAPDRDDGFPRTYIPGRNLFFLTVAAVMCERLQIKNIVTGTCETDYSGYPDCRDDSIKAMQIALNLGMASRFTIHTPLMWIDKAQTWKLAQVLGGETLVELIREKTHTCYAGVRDTYHDWGYGCAECDACKLRSRGWDNFMSESVIVV